MRSRALCAKLEAQAATVANLKTQQVLLSAAWTDETAAKERAQAGKQAADEAAKVSTCGCTRDSSQGSQCLASAPHLLSCVCVWCPCNLPGFCRRGSSGGTAT